MLAPDSIARDDGNLINIVPLQLGEEVFQVHGKKEFTTGGRACAIYRQVAQEFRCDTIFHPYFFAQTQTCNDLAGKPHERNKNYG